MAKLLARKVNSTATEGFDETVEFKVLMCSNAFLVAPPVPKLSSSVEYVTGIFVRSVRLDATIIFSKSWAWSQDIWWSIKVFLFIFKSGFGTQVAGLSLQPSPPARIIASLKFYPHL